MKKIHLTTVTIAATLALSACSILDGDKINYKSAGKGVSLEVPPDLSQLSQPSRYAVVDGQITASTYEGVQARQEQNKTATGANIAANKIQDIQYINQDGQRWLHISRKPEEIWSNIRDFWLENGFLLTIDDPKIGLLETDWAENRAKIPQDFIRRTIGKAFDAAYSTSERDRFRTRIERSQNGGSDIYLTHKGMIEEYAGLNKESTVWQPRARDTELEAEFLRRIMTSLGASKEQADAVKEQITQAAANPAAAGNAAGRAAKLVQTSNGQVAIELANDFDRTWRRTGLALDRSGFTVEDRNRQNGTYFVRYVSPNAQVKEPGFFGRILGRTPEAPPAKQYQIKIKSQAQISQISVTDVQGAQIAAQEQQTILQVIANDLN